MIIIHHKSSGPKNGWYPQYVITVSDKKFVSY